MVHHDTDSLEQDSSVFDFRVAPNKFRCSVSWAKISRQSPSFCSSTTGLNLESSFSWTGCHSKIKEPSLFYYCQIHVFFKAIDINWKANCFVRDLNSDHNCYTICCGVMVIIVQNEHGDMSSNPGHDCLHFS